MARKIIADTKGVSIIVGAMLLIVIVVVGAVAVAQLVSNLQEQAAEKASYKSAVEREELEVLKISLYDGATIDDFEGVYEIIKGKEGTEIGYRVLNRSYPYNGWHNTTNTTMDVVKAERPEAHGSYLLRVNGSAGSNIRKTFEPFDYPGTLSFWINSSVNGSVVNVTLFKDGKEVLNEPINITNTSEWQRHSTSTPVEFNEMEFELREDATIYLDDIQYTNPDYWGEIEVTIRNLNIDPCTLREVAIGVGGKSYPARNYSIYTKRGGEWEKESFTRLYPYDIPAHGTVPIRMNFLSDFGEPLEIPARQPLSIDVLLITDLGNNFIETFAPPVPVASVEIETEDIGVAYRDVLILDASDSYDPDGFITEYNWTIYGDDPSPRYLTGRKIRVYLSKEGPFEIDLKVTDDTGMVSRLSQISGYITIPANRNFNPPVCLDTDNDTYYYNKSTPPNLIHACLKPACLKDAKDECVKEENIPIKFEFLEGSGNVTRIEIEPSVNYTNSSGIASTNITNMTGLKGGWGIIRVKCDRLPYLNNYKNVKVINVTS